MISKTNRALKRSGKRADDGRQASNLVEDVVGPQKWMLCFPYGLGLDHHHMVVERRVETAGTTTMCLSQELI